MAGASIWWDFNDGVSSATSATVIGLTPGSVYEFRVRAVNAIGWGSVSAIVSATPYTLPGAPTGLSAIAGIGQVSLTWVAPANGWCG